MKYYKISLSKNLKGELQYPGGIKNYEEEVGSKSVDHLYWDEGAQTYLLLCIPNKETGILRAGIEEITEAAAKSISNINEPKTEKIIDEVKLRRLELKAALNQPLTQLELNAIDITNPDSIFKMTENLSDRIEKIK